MLLTNESYCKVVTVCFLLFLFFLQKEKSFSNGADFKKFDTDKYFRSLE